MNRRETLFLAAFLTLLSAAPAGRKALARASTPVVHAVLFHSPMCSFCEEIIEVKLPPQIKKYGTQLEILLVNIESQAGIALYKAALEAYGVDGGIPVLFLADLVLRGNAIPEELPAIVDSFLAQNGADWPAIPGLEEYRESLLATATPRPTIGLPSATPALTVAPSVAADTVARAVLFFSPTCSHCRHVQEDILPGLEKRFGKQLEIVSINTYLEEGYALYQAALSLFHLEPAVQRESGVMLMP